MKVDRTQFENNVSFDISNLPKFEPTTSSTGKSLKLYTSLSSEPLKLHPAFICFKANFTRGFPCTYNARGFCHRCPEHRHRKAQLYGSNSCPHEGSGNIFSCKTAKPLTELSPVVCRRHLKPPVFPAITCEELRRLGLDSDLSLKYSLCTAKIPILTGLNNLLAG